MPGIFGYIGRPSHRSDGLIDRMAQSMRHEPQQSCGTVRLDVLEAAAGWIAHPGSYSDCMPLWTEAKDVCVIFTGEHFGPRTDRSAAELLSQYIANEAQFWSSLNGVFAGVIFDLRPAKQKAVLFNDRYGLSRIYCRLAEKGLYFASEAKALLHQSDERAFDSASLAEYFTCGCALQGRTLFKNLQLLPPGARWTVQEGRVGTGAYFEWAELESLPELSPEAYYSEMSECLDRSMARYIRGPQSVALSVTGGVDSRMVLAGLGDAQLTTYTFSGIYREPADVRMGRQVAAACGLEHRSIPLDTSFFNDFRELAERAIYLSDGAIDTTGAVSLLMNRKAREIAPVRLTGNYGGEIIRGITGLKASKVDRTLFDPDFQRLLDQAQATLDVEKQARRGTYIGTKQIPWHHYGRYSIEQSQLTIRTPFLDIDLQRLLYQMPSALRLNKDLCYQYIYERSPRLAHVPTDRGTRFRPGLRREGSLYRARRWFEELMPRAEYVFDYGMPPWLSRINFYAEPLRPERFFLGNQKYYHFRLWFRRELSATVKEILLDPRSLTRPFLNRRRLEHVVRAHTSGSENHTLALHQLLSHELIHRTLLDPS